MANAADEATRKVKPKIDKVAAMAHQAVDKAADAAAHDGRKAGRAWRELERHPEEARRGHVQLRFRQSAEVGRDRGARRVPAEPHRPLEAARTWTTPGHRRCLARHDDRGRRTTTADARAHEAALRGTSSAPTARGAGRGLQRTDVGSRNGVEFPRARLARGAAGRRRARLDGRVGSRRGRLPRRDMAAA